MSSPSRKRFFIAILSALVLVTLLVAGSASSNDAAPELAADGVAQNMFPTFPGISSAYFTGTWCYIDCTDGSFDTVRAFSTSNCCEECLNVCGGGCVAEGGGPSVLCGAE